MGSVSVNSPCPEMKGGRGEGFKCTLLQEELVSSHPPLFLSLDGLTTGRGRSEITVDRKDTAHQKISSDWLNWFFYKSWLRCWLRNCIVYTY